MARSAACVDASVGAKWFLRDEPDGDTALILLDRFTNGEIDLCVPALFFYEMGSVFLTAVRRGRLTREAALDGAADLEGLHLDTVALTGELDAVLAFGLRLGLSLYDAAYVAAAESRGVPLLTYDRRLLEVASHHLDWVFTPEAVTL